MQFDLIMTSNIARKTNKVRGKRGDGKEKLMKRKRINTLNHQTCGNFDAAKLAKMK